MELPKILLCVVGFSVLVFYADAGQFNNNPGTVTVHENEDYAKNLWTISATCTVQYTCGYTCSYDCSYDDCHWLDLLSLFCNRVYQICYTTCYTTCSTDVTCDSCQLTNSAGGWFSLSSKTVSKVACTDSGCGPTCSAVGCLDAYETYTGTVQCWQSSYTSMTNNGLISASFTMSVTANAAPTFYFANGNLITVYKSSVSVGSTVNTMVASDSDAYIDSDTITYSLISGPGLSYIHQNTLFTLTSTGLIQVSSDLSMEFSYTFEMVVTVHDRRHDTTTGTLSISLYACYQTPNCTDKSTTIADTHGSYTGHGTTDTIYTMTAADANAHFTNFRLNWLQLQWTFVYILNSHSNIAQNYYTGVIYSTGNLSIFPSYPSKDFTLRVTVGNSESCYTTTCDMDLTITFTNWDIVFVSLPATHYINEDNDNLMRVHRIITYDYNYYWEDNVTCAITSISPNELNMFELRNEDNGEGTHSYNSFEIWRLACQYPLCGFKYSVWGAFLCPTDKGCFNHNITQTYVISIQCNDAYGVVINSAVTVRIVQNQAPVYLNLPLTITEDTDAISHYDTIFSIRYSDNENEDIILEHVFGPTDYLWFNGSLAANYYNNLANISMTTYQWNTTANTTHTDEICSHERRNEICATLTIQMNSNCGDVPTCSDQVTNVTTEFATGGKLFDISATSGHTSCTFSFSSEQMEYFTIGSNSGELTTTKALDAALTGTSYSLVAYIYHSSSCTYGSCSLTVNVEAVNYPITIDNLGVSVSIHEDTLIETTLIRLTTSDNNADDDVICDVTDISPAPTIATVFFEQETFTGSNVFEILSRASPGFTSATTQYLVTCECNDGRGETATGTLTVNIDLNQAPTFTNLPSSITSDQYTVTNGTTVFVVSVSDTENDNITYNCYVDNSFVPLECSSHQSNYVIMRRNVDIQTENNAVYTITVCIGDAKHTNDSCGILTVTFTSSVTHPVLSNLPNTASVAENTAAQTSVFQLAVTDPDAGDVHTFLFSSASPAGSISSFWVHSSTGVVYTNTVFDYESETLYTLTFTVRDQALEATETWDLNVTITNVNEAPTLTANTTTISFPEDTAVGTTLSDPGFSCTDPDSGETLTYSFTGANSSAFSQVPGNGRFILSTTWDLENAAYSTTTTLTSVCTDSGSLSSTVQIQVDSSPVNEFSPTLSTVFSLGATPQITSSTSLASVFLIITATDSDIFDDGSFTMEIMQPDSSGSGTLASQYFFINTLTSATGSSKGALMLSKSPSFVHNVTFTVTVKVSDGDVPNLFSTEQITIYYLASEPTVEGKPTKCMTCTSNGRVLIAVLCIEAFLVTVILSHIIWNFACRRNAVASLRKPYRKTSRRTGPSPSVRSRGSVSLGGSRGTVSLSGVSTGLAAANANPRSGRRLEISDSSSDSDSDSDDSVPPSTFRSEVGRRGFSMPNSTNSTPGLPPPMFASPVRNPLTSGLPRPMYSSNTASFTQPSIPGSSAGNAFSPGNQASRVVGRRNQPPNANPFSTPGLFQPNYA